MATALTAHLIAQVGTPAASADGSFDDVAKPFLKQNCVRCHNADVAMSGVRVDQLDGALEDRYLKLWEAVGKRIAEGTMPPKGQPQPSAADRQRMQEWIHHSLDVARLRPAPKNGLVRRLTVAQYRNTLRELMGIDDDLTEALPPEAVSSDGFVNNRETLQLSPVLLEAYFEIADEALNRAIVDPNSKPSIQRFKVELGASLNANPLPERLILGANSLLLENRDFVVTEPPVQKPFAFQPHPMRTKYRFIEGYAGNDTVRDWRDYDSIYHSVFACMRGNPGYPKGAPYSTVKEGLLLRPAIPTDEHFGVDSTYGPKANFKISLRELPDDGRFRVTVKAAKYQDGLLLDPGTPSAGQASEAVVWNDPKTPATVTIKKAGVYQVDVYPGSRQEPSTVTDASRLEDGLAGSWLSKNSSAGGRMDGNAHLVDSPFGKIASLDGDGDAVVVSRSEAVNVGTGDFSVSVWIRPAKLQKSGIIGLGNTGGHGWYLDLPDDKGAVRLDSGGPENQENGTMLSPPGMIRTNAWQHVAAVVRRGKQSLLYVNGYPVAKGTIWAENLDNPKANLNLGRTGGAQTFNGELGEVRLYRRALAEAEIQALVQPGRQFVQRPAEEVSQNLTLTMGDRQFLGTLQPPAFLAVRLAAGPLKLQLDHAGITELDRVVLTPIAGDNEVSKRFLAFEKRAPRLGVHLGLRRDCGSTLAQVGNMQTVGSSKLSSFVFEGAIRNFPSPEVEKDNVNYLAGIREIGVRSEYTDGRDMPRLVIRSVEFEGPYYEQWPPASHRGIFLDSPHKDNLPVYAKEIIRNFATRAFRRPITAQEEGSLVAVYEKSFAESKNFQESIKDALRVVLTSPQFLFLIETSKTPEPEPLDDYELASKLSYFLWNGPPDNKTLKLASAGTLRKQLDSEVDRMIADPRFSRFTREFTSQWLALDKFSVLDPDRKRFPKLSRDARAQLREEPIQFVQYLIQHNLPVRNLVKSNFVLANEVVAHYYDMADKTESGFQFVAISHDRRDLGGVLTEPAILAGLSDGRESNPVKRGAWLARRIIAEPPDPPPPNVPALKESTANLTLRERLEQHRNQAGCRQCHAKIDPWGVALEEFDAGGRLKQEPVDARSKLPDKTEVTGIDDLRRYLAEDRIDQVAFSVLKHLATYGTGRTLTYNELHFLKQEGLKLKANDYRMRDMIRFVADSKMFLEK